MKKIVEINNRSFESLTKEAPKLLYTNLGGPPATLCDLINEGWHKVEGDFGMGWFDDSNTRNAILKWLNDFSEGYYIFWNTKLFLFTEEIDAIAFKLRWAE